MYDGTNSRVIDVETSGKFSLRDTFRIEMPNLQNLFGIEFGKMIAFAVVRCQFASWT